MEKKIIFNVKPMVFLGLTGMLLSVGAQEIDWYSVDGGGGVSSGGDIVLSGVVGQTDVVRMEGGSVTLASGYLPLPADLIFENPFD